MVKVIDWRCSNGQCSGAVLAKVVNIETGWIERKCRKCGRTAHVGNERGQETEVEIKCSGSSGHRHTLARASSNWRGTVTIWCDRCKTESVIPAST